MARSNSRWNQTADSDNEDSSRESTPLSTAPNDRKRMRPSTRPEVAPANFEPRVTVQRSTNVDCRNNNGDEATARTRRKHQPGAIVRVKLTNFVTYTSAEFFPGPNLNMVIGPNGTGKSTLVCAICLGLGWGPQLLGRAKDPSEFVKHGCKEAAIEVELQRHERGPNKTKDNPVVTRKIRKEDNKSTFLVNGKPAPNKMVLEMVKQNFNIQVDNLCQFLPQDRVVEFAQQNTVQMLETTLEAAADPEVREYHHKLKSIREKQLELLGDNKGDRETLENLEKRQEAQQATVDRVKERQATKKKIDQLEKCRPIAKYMEAKTKVSILRKLKDDLAKDTRQLKQECEPALRKVNEKQEYAKAAKDNLQAHKDEVRRADNECKRIEREVTSYDEQMKECVARNDAERKGATKDKAELGKQRSDLQRLRVRKEEEPEPFDSRMMNDQVANHTNRARELKERGDDLQSEIREWVAQGKEKRDQKARLNDMIENLNTQAGQQEFKLESISKDTYRAWQWIKENNQRFKKEVFGPPAVTCRVKDPSMATRVEAALQTSDFKIITVQCNEDFKILQDELTRKQRLHDISIRTCTIDNLSSFKTPFSDDQLHQLGLEQWVIDCLDGPSVVLSMLCQERFLHQTAISSSAVSDAQHEAITRSSLKSYVAGAHTVRMTRRAEYGDAGIGSSIRDIQKARFWTDQPLDTGRKREWHEQIKNLTRDGFELKENIQKNVAEIDDIKKERQEEERLADKIREDKDAKQKALMEWRGLDTKIDNAEERIAYYQSRIDSFRDRCLEILKQKDEAMFRKAEAVLKYCEAAHTLRDLSAKLLEAEVVAIEAQSDSETLQAINAHIRDTLQRKEAELKSAEAGHNEARAAATQYLAQVEIVKAEAEELMSRGDRSLWELLVEDLARIKDKPIEEEIDARLESAHAQLELHAGGTDGANTIREYEERAKKIDRLRLKLTAFEDKQAELHGAISEVRQVFEAELDDIVGKIDAAFAESFERIGCAGQVEVYKASSDDPADCTEDLGGTENGLDFANWAIHISVKFRENEPLALLDSHRQSGGERAVSTIFYLMALQSLSKSPFRVVDEINQGMDPRNERMVHGRMVDIASDNERLVEEGKSSGSQYFLITPKLLSGLKYERGMTVLCIVSGENMPSATDVKRRREDGNEDVVKGRKIDFAAFARRARELGMGQSSAAAGRRVDSGVGMSRSVPVGA